MSSRMRSATGMFAVVCSGVLVVWCGGSPTQPPTPPPTTPPPPTLAPGNPTADCGGSYGPVPAGRDVTFSGLKSTTPNPPLAYSWDAGDKSAAMTGATPTHQYAKCKAGTAGCFASMTFTVTLTVTDGANRSASCQTICKVTGLY